MRNKKIINILFLILFFNIGNLLSQWKTEAQFPDNITLFYVNAVDTGIAWTIGTSSLYQLDTPFIAIRKPGTAGWKALYYGDMDLPAGAIYHCIKGLSDSVALVGNYNGQVFLTSNAGNNWVLKIDAGQSSFINDIKFSRQNKNIGFVFCDPPSGPGGNFEIYNFDRSSFGLEASGYNARITRNFN